MRKTRFGFLFCAVLLVGVVLPVGAALAQAGAVVRLAPQPASVGEGQTAAVEVRIDNVQNLYGLDIRLSFDPTIVEVVDADPNLAGVQVRPGDLLKPDFVVKNVADNAQGTVWFALTQFNPSTEVTGSGTAFTLTFKGKQRGAASALAITYAKLANRSGEEIPATAQNGEIRVVAAAQAPASPTPAPVVPTSVPPTMAPTKPLPTMAPSPTPAVPPPTAWPTATPVATATRAPGGVTPTAEATGAAAPAATQPAAGSVTPATSTGTAQPTLRPPATPASQDSGIPGGSLVLLIVGVVAVVAFLAYRLWTAWSAARRPS